MPAVSPSLPEELAALDEQNAALHAAVMRAGLSEPSRGDILDKLYCARIVLAACRWWLARSESVSHD